MAPKAGTAVVPLIIAVDGRSGAGKTTLAVELAALLREHHTVSLFHLEDIYPGWDGLEAGMDRYVAGVLAPLTAGRTARWRAWDWTADDDGPEHSTEPADVVIVEGVGAACRAALELLDVSIWVEAPAEVRRTSALNRDGDTFAPFWERWARQEQAWLDRDQPQLTADLVVDGHRDPAAPQRVRLALTGLPQCGSLLAVERAQRRAVTLQVERLPGRPDGGDLFSALYGGSACAVWLDSSDSTAGGGGRSRFSILADDGGQFGQLARHTAGTTEVVSGPVTARVPGPFFRWLDGTWGRRSVPTPADYQCGFTLGWLGYLGYELKRETGGSSAPAGSLPDAALLFAGRAVVIDHEQEATYLLTLAGPGSHEEARGWASTARRAVVQASRPVAAPVSSGVEPGQPSPVFSARDTRDSYLDKVRRAQAEIRDGNTYEVCLTTALHARTAAPVDPLATYLSLRTASPAPFAHYLQFPGFAVASTSPERFLRLSATGTLRAEPIKGTRRRSPDPSTDHLLREDLRTSLKDRAENVMIVDLLRNDLSHAAVPGSVSVSRLCEIETYATVHQMVSTIDAQLRPGVSRAEAVAVAFPAGSMTGAPKISTMAILDQLENAPRGVYSGAVGYFSLNGAADLAVVIRTLVLEDDDGGTRLSLGVGGAITADSDPADEWEEVRTKAFGVLSGLGSDFPDS
ncbi:MULTISPECIES: aminodeoxychorismate synthase component I [unclassified Arthrobacter]|uniref:aminodeoxychorismate synthase component I n=1 Tax=unclassified Arthrobacter TaxID=235627 RepID=UPI001492E07E|nr:MULTISPECIES: aminodeoxychorismate synthase component I [unclassified Arthrobacter]MBE0009147.1 aminodeoxychorismate synthase component I [Arthrobacter sp. AET 35A]NOJ63044.1 aminodeoxychorismate synthase component I [Arthrobacter sp. 147(2020)]